MVKLKKKTSCNLKELVLAVDVGNTYIHLAVCRGDKIVSRQTIATVQNAAAQRIELNEVLASLRRNNRGLVCVLVCSVVPSVTKVLEILVLKNFNIKAQVVGRDVIVPMENLYRNPQHVGQDRLVCAYAACQLYGSPAIIIDLGTAITLDVVSEKREYLGGIIVPGIRITAETLFERTALLPLVDIHKPEHLIGKDTQGSILSGIFYGYGEMLKGLIRLLSHDFKNKPQVIVTGGHVKLMNEYIKDSIDVVDSDLVLKGLVLLGQRKLD
ncbi:MAG: type III pantothenate kinase [Candidatus Omnitrophica bacterium]|nr:type III pantothenate kinase [Candidatus Omnitrophota bacterium]